MALCLSGTGIAAASGASGPGIDAGSPAVDSAAVLQTDDGQTDDQNETVAEEPADDGGILATLGGLVRAVGGFFAYNRIGHALVGLPLGIYLGLKALAIYIERNQ